MKIDKCNAKQLKMYILHLLFFMSVERVERLCVRSSKSGIENRLIECNFNAFAVVFFFLLFTAAPGHLRMQMQFVEFLILIWWIDCVIEILFLIFTICRLDETTTSTHSCAHLYKPLSKQNYPG